MNAKISVFAICVEAIIYLLSTYNLHDNIKRRKVITVCRCNDKPLQKKQK